MRQSKEKKPINVKIGKNIKRQREARQLTQERLAEKVGRSVQFISDLERGVTGASLTTIIDLSQVLEVSTDSLLLGKDQMHDQEELSERLTDLTVNDRQNLAKIINDIHAFVQELGTGESGHSESSD